MKDVQSFDKIMIKLASPEQIRSWSYGEVKKPETINYRTLRPEKDGLFCERIFGTTKEWECYCGKFKSIRYRGVICDRCGVEVTHFRVRRERIGHVELAAPVSHIWYYRSVPSRMGLLLDMTSGQLRSVLYYEKYVVIEAGDSDYQKMDLLTEEEYQKVYERYGLSVMVGIGAEAIKTLLARMDLDLLAVELREKMVAKGAKSDRRLLKRLEVVENFRRSGNRPEWMIMEVIPVIPPDLRPMVQLDGGRFATSDLNDLYRRLINRNNRLKRLIQLNAPEVIVRNEKRMLQEAVDALFDNSRRKKMVKGSSNRPLKSLSDMLKGKQGRFRQNLLGKRVDYSGRSVIVVGPELKLHQCGLPAQMALELFKPFIMRRLLENETVHNLKRARILVEEGQDEVWKILDEIIKDHPVILNRAPTLHRLGMQAFEPLLVEGKAIRLHPLVCHAFNADFDGDQMAVHVPLTLAAQAECWSLMLSSNNLLNPANGQPIVFPSQDIVLGINYLTKIHPKGKGTGKVFSSESEVIFALEAKSISYNAAVRVPSRKAGWIETSPGRIILNDAFPSNVPFINETLGDKEIKRFIAEVYAKQGASATVLLLDAIKDVGFRYATLLGTTMGISDILVPAEKKTFIQRANQDVDKVQADYLRGVITGEERYNSIISIWSRTNEELTNKMMDDLKMDNYGFNPIHMMADSGARGSRNQIRQLAGMRGLMAKPSGDIIELAIRSNFKDGLSVIEFFISTNGARKGLADTALKTADAGYLTRRLVDIAQEVVVVEDDCGTINGITVSALKNGEDVLQTLRERIAGNFSAQRIVHPVTSEILIDVNEEISDEKALLIEELGFTHLYVRSVLSCETAHGVCVKCYGRNLAKNRPVDKGEAVGIIAAQSIGHPGTQLTMRTFHVGGVASMGSEDDTISFKYPVFIKNFVGSFFETEKGMLFTRKGFMHIYRILFEKTLSENDKLLVKDGSAVIKGTPLFSTKNEKEPVLADVVGTSHVRGSRLMVIASQEEVEIKNGSLVYVAPESYVSAREVIGRFDPFSEPIIAESDGIVSFRDILLGATLREEINLETGNTEKKIMDYTLESLDPTLEIRSPSGKVMASYVLPGGVYLQVEDGQRVQRGMILAKISKGSEKTQDITGGLPRVNDLFETRVGRDSLVMARVTGTVRFRPIQKGYRLILIEDPYGQEFPHLVPISKHLLVRDGDPVKAGDALCDGSVNPNNVLEVLGENALQSFLVKEVQDVYTRQGVNIHQKHIEVIIRQMMSKVEIIDVGDTSFIYGQIVDKQVFHKENEVVLNNGGQVAIATPHLLGITRASLKIDSFISAASFQETTRVLTEAALAGRVDELRGLKENVVIGHLIPAGTGVRDYREIKVERKSPGLA